MKYIAITAIPSLRINAGDYVSLTTKQAAFFLADGSLSIKTPAKDAPAIKQKKVEQDVKDKS